MRYFHHNREAVIRMHSDGTLTYQVFGDERGWVPCQNLKNPTLNGYPELSKAEAKEMVEKEGGVW